MDLKSHMATDGTGRDHYGCTFKDGNLNITFDAYVKPAPTRFSLPPAMGFELDVDDDKGPYFREQLRYSFDRFELDGLGFRMEARTPKTNGSVKSKASSLRPNQKPETLNPKPILQPALASALLTWS